VLSPTLARFEVPIPRLPVAGKNTNFSEATFKELIPVTVFIVVDNPIKIISSVSLESEINISAPAPLNPCSP